MPVLLNSFMPAAQGLIPMRRAIDEQKNSHFSLIEGIFSEGIWINCGERNLSKAGVIPLKRGYDRRENRHDFVK